MSMYSMVGFCGLQIKAVTLNPIFNIVFLNPIFNCSYKSNFNGKPSLLPLSYPSTSPKSMSNFSVTNQMTKVVLPTSPKSSLRSWYNHRGWDHDHPPVHWTTHMRHCQSYFQYHPISILTVSPTASCHTI